MTSRNATLEDTQVLLTDILSQLPKDVRDETTMEAEKVSRSACLVDGAWLYHEGPKVRLHFGKTTGDDFWIRDRYYKIRWNKNRMAWTVSDSLWATLREYKSRKASYTERKVQEQARRVKQREEREAAWRTFFPTLPQGFNIRNAGPETTGHIDLRQGKVSLDVTYSLQTKEWKVYRASITVNNPSLEDIQTLVSIQSEGV